MDEFDSLCKPLLDGESHQLQLSPLVRRTLERQKRDHQIQVQKRRNMSSIVDADNRESHNSDVMIPIKPGKGIRIADTLLFIKEGYIVYDEELSETVRVCLGHDLADDDNTSIPREHKSRWYPSREWWAGVAFTTVVAVVASVMAGRKRA
jgi:hypothetical protein